MDLRCPRPPIPERHGLAARQRFDHAVISHRATGAESLGLYTIGPPCGAGFRWRGGDEPGNYPPYEFLIRQRDHSFVDGATQFGVTDPYGGHDM